MRTKSCSDFPPESVSSSHVQYQDQENTTVGQPLYNCFMFPWVDKILDKVKWENYAKKLPFSKKHHPVILTTH